MVEGTEGSVSVVFLVSCWSGVVGIVCTLGDHFGLRTVAVGSQYLHSISTTSERSQTVSHP